MGDLPSRAKRGTVTVQDADAARGGPDITLYARRNQGDTRRGCQLLQRWRAAESEPGFRDSAPQARDEEKRALVAFLGSLSGQLRQGR